MTKSKTARTAGGLERYSVAMHEAAHLLAALHVGAGLGRPAALVRNDGGETRCRAGVGPDAALVHMAGPASTRLFANSFGLGRVRFVSPAVAQQDWQAAACALLGHPTCGARHPTARRRVEEALRQAEAFLSRRIEALLDLTEALNQRGRLSASEAKRITTRAAAG